MTAPVCSCEAELALASSSILRKFGAYIGVARRLDDAQTLLPGVPEASASTLKSMPGASARATTTDARSHRIRYDRCFLVLL